MYKGYTNEELIVLFRDPSNKTYKFTEFMDKLKEKVCQPSEQIESLPNTLETTTESDLELDSMSEVSDS